MATKKKPQPQQPRRKKADPRDPEALALFVAGVSFELIAVKLRFRNAEAAEEAATRALSAQVDPDPEAVRRIELYRLDVMHLALWPKARKGDRAAIAQIMEIQRQRRRLGDPSADEVESLLSAVDLTLLSAEHVEQDGVDAALCASARKIGALIDKASATGNLEVQQKAMFALPHLVNVLAQLRVTPATRAAAQPAGKQGGSVSRLAEYKRRNSA